MFFPFTSFFAQRGHGSLLSRGTGQNCMVNIEYCICRGEIKTRQLSLKTSGPHDQEQRIGLCPLQMYTI